MLLFDPLKQRSTETFSTGLADEKLMFENRHELVGTREFIRYPSVQDDPMDFQTLIPHRKGRSGTYPPNSAIEFSSDIRGSLMIRTCRYFHNLKPIHQNSGLFPTLIRHVLSTNQLVTLRISYRNLTLL